MIIKTLVLLLLLSNKSDTLVLPIADGIVKKDLSNTKVFHESLEVKIYPTRSFEVRSLSSGKVSVIYRRPDGDYSIVILSGNMTFTYILDSSSVKRNDQVERGHVIGKLKNGNLVGENENMLVLSVMKNGQLVNPKKFLVFK